MKIYLALKRGTYHDTFCEDFLTTYHLNNNLFVGAICDGCTNGKDSHFASTLYCKALKKVFIDISYQLLYQRQLETNLKALQKLIFKGLFEYLKEVKNKLLLEREELLSTLILLIINKQSGEIVCQIIGDGLLVVNNNFYEVDNNDLPDYLGYHIDENFEDWYKKQTHFYQFNKVKDVSICSDGIFTLKPQVLNANTSINPEHYLLIDNTYFEKDLMLRKKLKELEGNYQTEPNDDLAIIRVKLS